MMKYLLRNIKIVLVVKASFFLAMVWNAARCVSVQMIVD